MGTSAAERVRLSTPKALPELRLISARIHTLAYRPHAHEEYAIGVVGEGVQRFKEPGGSYTAPPGTLFTLNPGDVHAGEPASKKGYSYRLAYIPAGTLTRYLEGEPGASPGHPTFHRRLTDDPELAPRFHRLLTALDGGSGCGVAIESEMVLLLKVLFARYGESSPALGRRGLDTSMAHVREMIHLRAHEPLTLGEMAGAAGLSRYHFIRVFQKATGLAPHAFLTQERVFRARAAIESGATLVDAALASGFSDQSHMTRQFKSIVGVTPGRFRALICA